MFVCLDQAGEPADLAARPPRSTVKVLIGRTCSGTGGVSCPQPATPAARASPMQSRRASGRITPSSTTRTETAFRNPSGPQLDRGSRGRTQDPSCAKRTRSVAPTILIRSGKHSTGKRVDDFDENGAASRYMPLRRQRADRGLRPAAAAGLAQSARTGRDGRLTETARPCRRRQSEAGLNTNRRPSGDSRLTCNSRSVREDRKFQ